MLIIVLGLLAAFAVPIALLVLSVETLDASLAGACDYGLLHVWTYIIATVFILDIVTILRYFVNTEDSRDRSEAAVAAVAAAAATPRSHGLRQPTEGFTSYPVPASICLLPLDRCALYQPEEHPSDNDLDCAETSNCCFFLANPIVKLSLIVWGHVMLHGELVKLSPQSGSNATEVSRFECLSSESGTPLQFANVCLATLIFGWVVWCSQMVGCVSPLLVSDASGRGNEFQRSRARRKLYNQSHGSSGGGGGGGGGSSTLPAVANPVAVHVNPENTNVDINLQPPASSNMTRTVDVEMGTPTLAPTCLTLVTATATTLDVSWEGTGNTLGQQYTLRVFPYSTQEQEIAVLELIQEQKIEACGLTETGRIVGLEAGTSYVVTCSVSARGNSQSEGPEATRIFTTEGVESVEVEDTHFEYVAKGVGNGALFVGRGMFRAAAWGMGSLFATGSREEKTGEGGGGEKE